MNTPVASFDQLSLRRRITADLLKTGGHLFKLLVKLLQARISGTLQREATQGSSRPEKRDKKRQGHHATRGILTKLDCRQVKYDF